MTKQTPELLSIQMDEDYNFLLSILPTMKQFCEMDKLKLRCEILQLVMKYKEQSKCGVQPTTPQTIMSSNLVQTFLPQ
jgi:hypothetical protein